MGIFDTLKKAAQAAENISKLAAQMEQKQQSASTAPVPAAAPKPAAAAPSAPPAQSGYTPAALLASGNTPAKDAVEQRSLLREAPQFLLSADFVEFDSGTELNPAFLYEPDYQAEEGFEDEPYTEYKEHYPAIAFGPSFFADHSVYDAAKAYYETGAMAGENPVKLDNGLFAFRTKLYSAKHNMNAYVYIFAQGTSHAYEMFGLEYEPELNGTALEQKLMRILDEAAESLAGSC